MLINENSETWNKVEPFGADKQSIFKIVLRFAISKRNRKIFFLKLV